MNFNTKIWAVLLLFCVHTPYYFRLKSFYLSCPDKILPFLFTIHVTCQKTVDKGATNCPFGHICDRRCECWRGGNKTDGWDLCKWQRGDKGGEWTVRLERKKIIACGRRSRIEGMGVIRREKIKDCNHRKKIPWQSLNTKPVLNAERSAA